MTTRRALLLGLAATALAVGGAAATQLRKPDVRYDPTPPAVVRLMLELAEVGPRDVVYDLGCGDGRILVEAARRGARAVGVEIDPALVKLARENARVAGVADRVEIREGDLFEADVRDATVVALFLWPSVNLRLRPRLLEQLRPGARVVSYWHDMGDWKPDRTVPTERAKVYLWNIREAGAR